MGGSGTGGLGMRDRFLDDYVLVYLMIALYLQYCSRRSENVPSYCPHQPTASSVAFHPTSPATSHHSFRLRLTEERSPAVKADDSE